MKRPSATVAAGLALFAASVSAIGPSAALGSENQTKDPELNEQLSNGAAITAARQIGSCAVKKHPVDVQVVLNATDWNSFESARKSLEPKLSRCFENVPSWYSKLELRFAAQAVVGILAEAWFDNRDLPQLDPAPYTRETPSLMWLARSANDSVLLKLADCMVHHDPQSVAAIVRSSPSSGHEDAAFAAIEPKLPGCLDSNVMLSGSRSSLRLAFATALYKRSTTPSVQQIKALR